MSEPDFFAAASAAKAERKRALLDAITGRPSQPRDAHGRWTGFDGGARRESVPQPPEGHDRWLARVIRERRADAGARF